MNFSISNLFLAKTTYNSPILTFTGTNCYKSAKLKRSLFYKTFSSPFFAQCISKIKIKEASFVKTLNSAVIINDKLNYKKKIYNDSFNYSYTEVSLKLCSFIACISQEGGAINAFYCITTLLYTDFTQNSAKVAGACKFSYCKGTHKSLCTYTNNTADYIGAVIAEGQGYNSTTFFLQTNFTKNSAKMWEGGLRVDDSTGQVMGCYFSNNTALVSAAYFDYTAKPIKREIKKNVFLANKCTTRAAVTCFHILHYSSFENCLFYKNKCKEKPNSISVESIYSVVEIENCCFDGTREDEVTQKFGYSNLTFINNEWNTNGREKNMRKFL